jgi:hypothetical protein
MPQLDLSQTARHDTRHDDDRHIDYQAAEMIASAGFLSLRRHHAITRLFSQLGAHGY